MCVCVYVYVCKCDYVFFCTIHPSNLSNHLSSLLKKTNTVLTSPFKITQTVLFPQCTAVASRLILVYILDAPVMPLLLFYR